jgi:N-acetylglucosamine-6-phosphate deacetylase
VTARFLAGAALLLDGAWQPGLGILVRDGMIEAVLPETAALSADRVALPPDALVAPGLIDIQVNGGGGILFNDDPTPGAARAIAAAHRRMGTTAILPTLITDGFTQMRAAADAVAQAAGPGTGIAGIHFEGPFLSPLRPGVHVQSLIRPPEEADLCLLEALAARLDGPVLLTLAPEVVEDAVLHRLSRAGIILAAGHSVAGFERCAAALSAGLTGFTHVFNAMPPMAARSPGIAAAALLDRESWCGVIADGIHVHPALLRLLFAAKPADRIILVSDAMPPVGTAIDSFQLQGRTIMRRQGRLETEDGTLAGADICLLDAVRCAIRLLGLAPAQALALASATPAAFLRQQHRIGRIAPGLQADLLLLTEDLSVLGTWVSGAWQGQAGILPAGLAA